MSNDQSSFSADKEYPVSCTATQGICEKLIQPQKFREMAGRDRDSDIATSTLLDDQQSVFGQYK